MRCLCTMRPRTAHTAVRANARFRPADGNAFPRQVPGVIASCSRLNGDGDTVSVGDRIRFSVGGHALRQGCPREMTETRKLAAILAADERLRGKPRPRTN